MSTTLRGRRLPALLAAAALAAGALVYVGWEPAQANHAPADKVTATGVIHEVFDTDDQPVTLASGTLRTSSPTDLVLQVTAECSITNEVTTIGSDLQRSTGQVQVWVEVDGVPVGVTAGDDGTVVFCNRTYERETAFSDPEDEENSIRTFIETRAANGFNWVALNVGSGIHTVVVKAALTTAATDSASAK
ncbi:MAG TPA: hypothetical protein VM618_13405, partial [Acidimicrobiia bacterium]|nr:hypothetical protein [Acidimicrobiia bacterium]